MTADLEPGGRLANQESIDRFNREAPLMLRALPALTLFTFLMFTFVRLPWWAWLFVNVAVWYIGFRIALHWGLVVSIAASRWKVFLIDLRHLWLWARLAFSKKEDDRDHLAMAQQQQFLTGRMLSPTRIFTIIPLVLGVVGLVLALVFGLIAQGARAELANVRNQRDNAITRANAFEEAMQRSAAAHEVDTARRLQQARAEVVFEMRQRELNAARAQRAASRHALETDTTLAPVDFSERVRELAEPANAGFEPPGEPAGPDASGAVPAEQPAASDNPTSQPPPAP